MRDLTDAEVAERITPLLRAKEVIVPPVQLAVFGPGPGTALVLYERGGMFGAFAVSDASRAGGRRIELPDLTQGLLDNVASVMFLDADPAYPGMEIIIMTEQMTGIGPEGAMPQRFNLVVGWDGAAFHRIEALEERVRDSATAPEIINTLGDKAHEQGKKP